MSQILFNKDRNRRLYRIRMSLGLVSFECYFILMISFFVMCFLLFWLWQISCCQFAILGLSFFHSCQFYIFFMFFFISSFLANFIFFHILFLFKTHLSTDKTYNYALDNSLQLSVYLQAQHSSKQNYMNFETYQHYTQSLEKQIESRQQERIKMTVTIDSLNLQLEQEVQKNKSIKEELNRNVQSNQSLLLEFHVREKVIQEQKSQINKQQTSDEYNKQKMLRLQKQKKNFQDELKQKDTIIFQNNLKLENLQVEVNKNLSQLKEYRKILSQKTKEMANLQTRASQFQFQKQNISKQLQTLKQQYKQQGQSMQSQIEHSNITVELTTQKYQNRITKLLQQLAQCKQLHKNQLKTMQFNHEQQVHQLQGQIVGLKKQILQYNEGMEQLIAVDKQLKRQFEAQTINKDEIVNQLINEINFIRAQKIQIENINQLQIQQFTQEILNIKMEKTLQLEKLQKLEEQIIQKDQKIIIITRQVQALEQDNKNYQREFLEEKDISFQRGEEIFQLKKQIENLTSTLQTVRRQKQSLFNSTSQQLNLLRQQNIDLQSSLITARSQIQEQSITQIQLYQKIKELTYECYSTAHSRDQLLQLINNHQNTIQNRQTLLQQSKKVIQEFSLMIKLRLEEIHVLEESNRMFRKQKIDWLKKEENYRKKIIELRNTQGTKKSFTPNLSTATLRSLHRAHTQIFNLGTQNALNSQRTQSTVYLHSSSNINDTYNRKKITSIRVPQRFYTYNHSEATDQKIPSSSNDDLDISIPQIQGMVTDIRLDNQPAKSLKIKELEFNQVVANQLMKKKQKILPFAAENGESKGRLKKDYSVGIINSVSNKEFSFFK